jgi:hypothetical protein
VVSLFRGGIYIHDERERPAGPSTMDQKDLALVQDERRAAMHGVPRVPHAEPLHDRP